MASAPQPQGARWVSPTLVRLAHSEDARAGDVLGQSEGEPTFAMNPQTLFYFS